MDVGTVHTARSRWKWPTWGLLGGLALSVLALGLAPRLMPPSYSWVVHSTSESAAQGVQGAWLARLGFLTFGLTVVWMAGVAGWGWWGAALHRAFGVFLVGTATFSHRPFEPGMAYDRFEDLLHSISATAMGFAFAIGVVAVALGRGRRIGLLDVLAVIASVVIPLAMATVPEYAGLLQRTMFAVAYAWYTNETLGAAGEVED